MTTRADCLTRDATDPLGHLRGRFHLPDGLIYLDGNSLGALPVGVARRLDRVVEQEWGADLVGSWNRNGWWEAPGRVGDRLAPLIGAAPGEVVVCDSTSVNLFKLLVAAARLRPGRDVVVTEAANFPSDRYIIDSAAALLGLEVRLADPDRLADSVDERTAVVVLTHVNFRTGRLLDLPGITADAHAAGALVLWDLSHSAGAVPVDLGAARADLAVGCGYKYLNGGPGAPAFAFVARRHHDGLAQPLTGWIGHARPFAMEPGYEPVAGVGRVLAGTPPILSLAALEAALDVFDGVAMADVRAKSVALTDLFTDLVVERLGGHDLEVVSPLDPQRRGSQVCLEHLEGYAIVQALAARGVIGDYRDPGILRFGVAPLYVRFVDVWDAVDHLRAVMDGEEWRRPEFQEPATVT